MQQQQAQQEFVGNACTPDWIQANQVFPRALIGQTAPYFEAQAVKDLEFVNVKLSDYEGKYLVLFFYPLDFTFVCPTEIIAFADAAPRFEENGCAIVGASCDSQFSHFEYCSKKRKRGGLGNLQIPLLADYTKTIARIYGALLTQGNDCGVALRYVFFSQKFLFIILKFIFDFYFDKLIIPKIIFLSKFIKNIFSKKISKKNLEKKF